MGLVIPEGVERFYLAQRSEPRSAETYAAAVQFDFEAMKPWLLEGDMLDIGCGVGGPTSLIAQHCKGRVHLVDGTDWGERHVGFGSTMEPYNDRTATEIMLRANGITDFQWWPVGATELPQVMNVVSLISWGWHYPVSTYLTAVEKALPQGGRLILDLRPGKPHMLAKSFEQIGEYQGFGKCNKTVWQRRA